MSASNSIPITVGLKEGDQGKDVTRLQNYLTRFGYFDAEVLDSFVDTASLVSSPAPQAGRFDDKTRCAMEAFQSAQGLPVTGEFDAATRDLMSLPRCGVHDTAAFTLEGRKWEKNNLTYGFQNFTPDLNADECRGAIRQALDLWSAVTSLRFSEVPVASNPDIVIRFVTGDHGDEEPFDGFGNIFAHGFFPPPNHGSLAGDVHFDEAEPWTINPPAGINPPDLVTVAAHEFGHSLGLDHSSVRNALMYTYYSGPHRHLHADDIAGIQQLYPLPDPLNAAILHPNGKAYFFRGNLYQRYDFNQESADKVGRTGVDGWSGVWERGIDAAILHPNGKAYFFQGDQYQRFDFDQDKVDRIARVGVNGWRGVWNNGLDAALLHPNGKAYFFRGDQYQRFDFSQDKVDKTGRIGVDGWRGVWNNGLDAALLHPNGKAYFFRGDQYQRFDFDQEQVDKTGRVGVDGWFGI